MTADYAEIRSPALVFKELADRATASADPPLRIITPAHGFTELFGRSVASTDQSKKKNTMNPAIEVKQNLPIGPRPTQLYP